MISFGSWPDHVYIASAGPTLHKIGKTKNPKVRRYQLQRELGRLVSFVHVDPPTQDADAIETTAHWLMEADLDFGEWFAVDELTARAALAKAKELVAAGNLPTRRLTLEKRSLLGEAVEARVDAARRPGETRKGFIREAVEREIKRRERTKR